MFWHLGSSQTGESFGPNVQTHPPISPPGSLMDVPCTLSSCSSSWLQLSAPSGLRRDHGSLPATSLIPTLFATSIIIIRISLGCQVLSLEGGLLTYDCFFQSYSVFSDLFYYSFLLRLRPSHFVLHPDWVHLCPVSLSVEYLYASCALVQCQSILVP